MELSLLGWALALLAAVMVGLSKGGVPMAASLSVPILTIVMAPVAAAGLLLPVYIVADMFGLWAYRKEFDKRVLAIMIPATTLGIGIGWATAEIVPERWVTLMVGVIGAVFALNALFRHRHGARQEAKVAPGLFWGTIAGITSFVSHSGAPPFQAYTIPLNLPKQVFAGTATVLFSYVNLAKLGPYIALGEVNWDSLDTALILAIPASASVFLGVWLVKRMPTEIFFKVVIWALLLISLKLIQQAITG
ncbi:sulfite exporter TauE/SafE family protein [Thioclava sp. JE_KL1]|uniref:sulfite exporter TauE/SafE family protein n=1 Tax=Thioclava sp. JE_KL1 TaxID=2651187 RepID=UPI00128D2C27|nr:sulfite exporter TauE/SafE family protein [Thioclava sp. JE_KL1]MPQ92433.1 sulfite exporter TauE/SafE family protein [Thioclava sp. JE_KL1]